MSENIHVISLTIPYPANYGGVIDIFYKLKALSELGLNIHLHCYRYDREVAYELEKICKKVSYYDRRLKLIDAFSTTPFIVRSRENQELNTTLNKDTHKIIVEGVHGLSILKDVNANRVYVRTHNIEQDYYKALSMASGSILKKVYYYLEHLKLKQFESRLKKVKGVFAISENDLDFFRKINNETHLIPAFHKHNKVYSKSGKGEFILIHGNLSVEENIKSITFLINHILCNCSVRVIIAGLNPVDKLVELCNRYDHISLIKNPKDEEMSNLLMNAQIILLHTFQATGIKLKLIHSLSLGRHIICNDLMIKNTGLEKLVNIANNPSEWLNYINQLMIKRYDSIANLKRLEVFDQHYNNTKSAKQIVTLLNS